MTKSEQIAADALTLPDDERAALAQVLWDSLSGEPEGLGEVLDRRSRDIRDGHATFRDPSEIFAVYEQMKKDRKSAPKS